MTHQRSGEKAARWRAIGQEWYLMHLLGAYTEMPHKRHAFDKGLHLLMVDLAQMPVFTEILMPSRQVIARKIRVILIR